MNAVAAETVVTPEQLLAMSEGKSYELVDSKLVRRNMGARSSWIGGKLLQRLANFSDQGNLGTVWGADNGYQCYPDAPDKVRKPDASFIRRERLDPAAIPDGFIMIVPDRVVQFERKVHEYLRAGVPRIWVVNEDLRQVRVHRPGETSVILSDGDELTGGDVLPGFRCPVADLFPPAPSPPAGPPGVH